MQKEHAENYAGDKCRDYRKNHHALASWRRTEPPKLLAQKLLFASVHLKRPFTKRRAKRLAVPLTFYLQPVENLIKRDSKRPACLTLPYESPTAKTSIIVHLTGLAFQSFQKFLNRSGAISVYRTVCMIFLCPK